MSKVTTPAGLTYVKDFSFPAAQGFSGSAGSHQVKGYQRGGAVKKACAKKGMPKNVKATGGTVMRDPRDLHSKLYDEGDRLGFMRGGQVKASPDFRMKTGKQKTMDTGNQPARKGRNQTEIEAGGTKKMKPGYAVGGAIGKAAKAGVHQVCSKMGYKKGESSAPRKGRGVRKGRSKKVVLSNKGGLMKYAAGGSVKK
jgi:hypothetical protein